ncbi:MAG: ribose-phosphate pyrophosphokinase [Candidatus Tectomicrobia bacterium]|nr:ribose-phosphate pyrophosphokinase [Candidatus Tectomicrobia bacterium]
MKDLRLFTGRANPRLACGICDYLGIDPGRIEVSDFSDGEVFVQIQENIRGQDVFLLQSTCNPVNHHLMELLIMADACRRASAARITAVIPYFGYGRQDRKDRPRVPITAKLVADLIAAAGVNRVLAIDLHAGQLQGYFNMPVDHLFAAPVLVDHFRQQELRDLTIIAPDAGGVERAAAYAKRLDASLAIIDKRRDRDKKNVAKVMHIIGDVCDRDVLIADDIVDTAGTLVEATTALLNAGARRVFAGAAHAVLSGPALDRIGSSGLQQLAVTDTIPLGPKADKADRVRVLSVAPLLGEAIRRIHSDDSVSSLFN